MPKEVIIEGFEITYNPHATHAWDGDSWIAETADEVSAFHRGIDGYEPTPLHSMRNLAAELGLEALWVKDESFRLGLNAFKALGASYAITRQLASSFALPLDETTWSALRSSDFRQKLKDFTFITATDGNHGRGVAWTAAELGAHARVLLPRGTANERYRNIAALGAETEITESDYDQTVRQASALAETHGWTLVQDTAWPGYEAIPRDIMRGYTTIGREIADQLEARNEKPPTHLLLQAGVGSMAAALADYAVALWQDRCPRIIVVEPCAADCLYQTAKADDRALHTTSGAMDSMMAGLDCGEPSFIAWDLLRKRASAFIACADRYSADGMKRLASPLGDDPLVVAGESGAVTFGVAVALSFDPALAAARDALKIDSSSRILVINTEGATDKANYRRIVGENPDELQPSA